MISSDHARLTQLFARTALLSGRRLVRVGTTEKKPLAIRKCDGAAIDLVFAVLRHVALDHNFGARFQGFLGEAAAQQNVRTAGLHHPVHHLAVVPFHVHVDPSVRVDPLRPSLGARPLGAITQFDIHSLYAQMFNRGLSPRTIEYTNAVLQSAFRQAVRWKMLADEPCVGVDLPPLKRREMDALSVEECRRFLTVARESEWYALFALALTTGMRPSEYLALKWSDIDWQRGTASVCRTIQISSTGWTFYDTKRKRSRRSVKLQNFVLEALEISAASVRRSMTSSSIRVDSP